jgi:hypothetical protein
VRLLELRELLEYPYHASLSGEKLVDGMDPAQCLARALPKLVSLNQDLSLALRRTYFQPAIYRLLNETLKGSSYAVTHC